jgi:hypothetical protein
MIAYRTSCCGVVEFDRLSAHTRPEDALKAVRVNALFGPMKQAAFALFTGVVRIKGAHGYMHTIPGGNQGNYGRAFADFITENKLGTVTAMPVTENPASGNDLGVWMWQINHPNLEAWFRANP